MSAPRPPQDRLAACVPRVGESALSRGASLTSLTAPRPRGWRSAQDEGALASVTAGASPL